MLKNKKGAALLQVLLVTAVLGGMAAMLLRAQLSRTTSVRQTRKAVSQELLIESCQAEINMMWSHKSPDAFERDLAGCWMNCNVAIDNDTYTGASYTTSKCHTESDTATRSYTCKVPVVGGDPINVTAEFLTHTENDQTVPNRTADGSCELKYTIDADASEKL